MIFLSINTRVLLAIALSVLVSPIKAHEYWLDPIDSSIATGSAAIVDIRNGQHFSGAAFPYDGSLYQSITVTNAEGSEPYSARLGDYPAIHPTLKTNGLHSISVDTAPKILVYDSLQKFEEFLQYHDLAQIAEQHQLRDLPTIDIKESYVRSAKTLIQVSDSGTISLTDSSANQTIQINDAQLALQPTNSLFEMVLLDDPYSKKSTLNAKLLFQGKPLAGRQVELFWKGTQSLRLTTKTNENGVATFKVLGNGDYMLNAVHVVESENKDVHWLSYWASMTFER